MCGKFQVWNYRRIVNIILSIIKQLIQEGRLELQTNRPISENRVVELIEESVVDYHVDDGGDSEQVKNVLDHKTPTTIEFFNNCHSNISFKYFS